jgi:urease accessory protein
MLTARRLTRSLGLAGVAGGAAVLFTATPAAAHTGRGAGGLLDGLLHPITGPDHLLAMLSVGVVAALSASRWRVWAAPAAFLGAMSVGGVVGMIGVPLPGAENLILASVFVLGIAIAAAFQGVGGWLFAALIVAGIAHGHAHGAEAPTSAHPVIYVAGFLAATASLHLFGVGVGTVIRERRSAHVGIGAATVAAGALLLTG